MERAKYQMTLLLLLLLLLILLFILLSSLLLLLLLSILSLLLVVVLLLYHFQAFEEFTMYEITNILVKKIANNLLYIVIFSDVR